MDPWLSLHRAFAVVQATRRRSIHQQGSTWSNQSSLRGRLEFPLIDTTNDVERSVAYLLSSWSAEVGVRFGHWRSRGREGRASPDGTWLWMSIEMAKATSS